MLILLSAAAGPAFSQTPPQDAQQQFESDSDPTRPVFVSIRPEFYNVSDGVDQRLLIARFDAAVLRRRRMFHGAPGLILRVEAPIVDADVHGSHGAGLGDVYGQVLVLPYSRPSFTWAVGSGFVLPTATHDLTGGNKWVVAPVGAPVWRMRRGLAFIKVQNFFSVAGDAGRPDLNYLLITPTFLHAVGKTWWVLADSESTTAWTDGGRTGIKSGFQLGRLMWTGVGVWVKPEVWWGPNRDGDWNLKFGVVWYQRR